MASLDTSCPVHSRHQRERERDKSCRHVVLTTVATWWRFQRRVGGWSRAQAPKKILSRCPAPDRAGVCWLWMVRFNGLGRYKKKFSNMALQWGFFWFYKTTNISQMGGNLGFLYWICPQILPTHELGSSAVRCWGSQMGGFYAVRSTIDRTARRVGGGENNTEATEWPENPPGPAGHSVRSESRRQGSIEPDSRYLRVSLRALAMDFVFGGGSRDGGGCSG